MSWNRLVNDIETWRDFWEEHHPEPEPILPAVKREPELLVKSFRRSPPTDEIRAYAKRISASSPAFVEFMKAHRAEARRTKAARDAETAAKVRQNAREARVKQLQEVSAAIDRGIADRTLSTVQVAQLEAKLAAAYQRLEAN
jgi:hypothetical protein